MAVLSAIFVVILLTFRDYGLGWDDYTHAEYGDLLLAYYLSGFQDKRALSFVNLYYYGGGFDLLSALAAKATGLDIFPARRLVGGLVGLIGLAIVWRLGRRLGGPAAGLFSLVLLAICPIYYGHMFINAKDAPFAVAMAGLLLALTRALQEAPRPKSSTVLLFGLALGLTLGTRIMGGIAVIFAAFAAIVFAIVETTRVDGRHARRSLARLVVTLLPGLPIAYGVMALVWPWAIQDPMNPVRAIAYFSTFFEVPWKELFEGRAILVPEMPRDYVPTLFSLKMPEAFLAAALAGVALAAHALFDARRDAGERASLALLLAAALVPVAMTVALRPAMYNGLRHFVFVTPPLAVLGGLAMAHAAGWLAARSRAALAGGAAAATLGIGVATADLARLHPYEYAHFNRVAGGIEEADGEFMLDYWGLSFKQAGEALKEKLAEKGIARPAHRRWKIATCGPHRPAAVALGPDFETTWDPRGADFALLLGEHYCRELAIEPMVEIERDGVTFATVHDLRGSRLDSVLAEPPLDETAAQAGPPPPP